MLRLSQFFPNMFTNEGSCVRLEKGERKNLVPKRKTRKNLARMMEVKLFLPQSQVGRQTSQPAGKQSHFISFLTLVLSSIPFSPYIYFFIVDKGKIDF